MTKHINYLFSLKTEKSDLLCTVKRKTFIIGLAAAVKSILQMAKNILIELPLKYLMTYRFSQDHLELFFAQVRKRNVLCNNPNAIQFKSIIRSLLVKNSISSVSVSSNCTPFESVNEIGFQLKWAQKQPSKWHDNNEQWKTTTIDDPNSNLLVKKFNSKMISEHVFINNNILYYISGFIIKKLFKIIQCSSCRNNIIQKASDNTNRLAHILVDVKTMED